MYENTAEFWRENCGKSGGMLHREHGGVNERSWRKRIAKAKQAHPHLAWLGCTPNMSPDYRESVEILENGSHRSDKLLLMDTSQVKDTAFLLKAHGYDCSQWEIVNAKNNIWNVYSKQDGVQTLYSSRVTVRPLVSIVSAEAIAAAVCKAVRPVKVASPKRGARCLEIANTDMHLGNSDLTWYRDTLARTIALIESGEWENVVLPVGSDLFHCDNFKNTTSNGTAQSSVAWPEAWADATSYFSALIESALKHSVKVYAYYVVGNHDESMSWAFCQMLSAKYPQVSFNLEIEERKVHRFHEVAIGMTHGDNRTRRDLDRIFMAEFPAFAQAAIREVHAAHYHHEVTKDEYGVVVRSLSTAARTDKWHREEGYVGACKRFQVFEYEPDSLTAIHYV